MDKCYLEDLFSSEVSTLSDDEFDNSLIDRSEEDRWERESWNQAVLFEGEGDDIIVKVSRY